MTRNELRENLKGIRSLEKEIACYHRRISELQDSVERTTPAYGTETVAHTPDVHAMESKLIEKVYLESQLEEICLRFTENKTRVIEAIASLSDPDYKSVMSRRYIDGKSWAEIAEIENKPVSTLRRWDREALDEMLNVCNF